MILDGILNCLKSVLVVMLSPLQIINISVDWFTSFDAIEDFFAVACYVLPWSNLKPLITIVIAITAFRVAISVMKTVRAII